MSAVLVIVWVGLIVFFLATLAATILRFREPRGVPGENLPPCSIIVPIKGASQYLDSNLRALAKLEPFRGEVLLAIPTEGDSAAQIIRPIVLEYPEKMKLLVGEASGFANPKLRNIAKAYRASREEIILFLDDSVELDPALFAELLRALKPGVTAVTAAPKGDDAENFFAEIEAASCNGYLFRIEMFLEIFGFAAVFGNALAFHKQDLESIGGFDRLKEGPCEDSVFSEVLLQAGARITLVRSGIRRRIGKRSWNDIYLRHIRWANCTKIHNPVIFLLEPLVGGLCFILLSAYALSILLGVPSWYGLILAMALRYGGEGILHWVCDWTMTVTTPLAWMVRDILQPLFMVGALLTREVDWRGEVINMRR